MFPSGHFTLKEIYKILIAPKLYAFLKAPSLGEQQVSLTQLIVRISIKYASERPLSSTFEDNMISLQVLSDLAYEDNPSVSLIFTVSMKRVSNVLYAIVC